MCGAVALLEGGWGALGWRDKTSGCTPLHAALRYGHYHVAALLLVAGAQAPESHDGVLSLKLREQRAARRHRASGDAARRCAQQLWCWGSDRSDFVTGLVTSGKQFVDPTPIHALQHERIVACAAGKRHSLCISDTGVVFGWGVFGEATVLEPTPLAWVARLGRVVAIAAGDDVSVALTENGRVFSRTGGSPHARCRLRKHSVVGIACGDRFALAWTSSGELYTWGANDAGQLASSDAKALREDVPCVVRFHSGKVQPRIVRAAGGGCVGVALDDDGALWLWGNGRAAPRRAYVGERNGGDIGANRSDGWVARSNEAVKASRRRVGFTDVAAAAAHVVALDTNGEVWVYSGEGLGARPVRIDSLPADIAVESVATSATRSIAVLCNGALACFDAASHTAESAASAAPPSTTAATRRVGGRRDGGEVSECEREAAVIPCVCCATAVALGALHTICIVRTDEPAPLREHCVAARVTPLNVAVRRSPRAQPHSLKFLCASKLARHVDVENVVAMAHAAQSVGARELAAYCREWITMNPDLVFSACARCARRGGGSFGALFRALASAESQEEWSQNCDAMLAVARAAQLEGDMHRARSTSPSLSGGRRPVSPPETPPLALKSDHPSYAGRARELVTSPPSSPARSAAGFGAPIVSVSKRSQRRARGRNRSKSLCSPSLSASTSVCSPRALSPRALAPSISPAKIPLRLNGASDALAGRRINSDDVEIGRVSVKQQRVMRRATLKEIMGSEAAAAAKRTTTSTPRREAGKRHVPWGGSSAPPRASLQDIMGSAAASQLGDAGALNVTPRLLQARSASAGCGGCSTASSCGGALLTLSEIRRAQVLARPRKVKRIAPAPLAWGRAATELARDAAMAPAQVATAPRLQLSLREIQQAEAKSGSASSAAVRAIRSSAAWGFRSADPDAARGFDAILKQEQAEEAIARSRASADAARVQQQQQQQQQRQRRRRGRKHDTALKKRMEEGTARLVTFGFDKGDAAAAMERAGGSFDGALNFLIGR